VLVEPLLHFSVPFASLKAVGLDWRMVVFGSAVALAPDLDVLFRFPRYLGHSAAIVGFVLLAAALLTFLVPEQKRKTAQLVVAVTAFAVTTRLLLDLFSGFTPLFWPLLNNSYAISSTVNLRISNVPAFGLDASSGSACRFRTFRHIRRTDGDG
jgi:membrane-bound metal-dependent hydrolase YbcI (DUF457 family)